ncbi:putative reductase [[Actinomadura] parvosata subsp. kistnae]|uniref:NADPH-dependent FMN reductase-like domain-containing protein n=2 Tax=Nonomuraea TaxID=83681 RepID=A0A1U9ZU59_9ACTN|nr:hypothetical protein BKM31_08370 [Nonomuraea sp. ATCC 55076]SPL98193.1 putative reductase [Actinomadura parvosata subsp. kistnae]
MVTPEHHHSTSGVLKNAIDYLFAEWNHKAFGIVSYVRTNVALSLFTDFQDFSELAAGDRQAATLATMLDEVVAWSRALAPLRQAA